MNPCIDKPTPDDLVTAEQLGKLYGLNPTTIRKWARAGKISYWAFGRKFRFSLEEFRHMMHSPTSVIHWVPRRDERHVNEEPQYRKETP